MQNCQRNIFHWQFSFEHPAEIPPIECYPITLHISFFEWPFFGSVFLASTYRHPPVPADTLTIVLRSLRNSSVVQNYHAFLLKSKHETSQQASSDYALLTPVRNFNRYIAIASKSICYFEASISQIQNNLPFIQRAYPLI